MNVCGLTGVLATLRLAPVVPTEVAMAQFPDVEHAVNAVQEILNTPHGPHIRESCHIVLGTTLTFPGLFQNAWSYSTITVRITFHM